MLTHRTGVRFLVVACAALAVALPSAGRAQGVTQPRVKIGAFIPIGNTSVADVGNVWFKIGADVDLATGLPLLGGRTRLEADYAVNGGNNVLPLTVNQIWQPSALVAESPAYFGIGVGVWFTHLSGVDSSTRLGVRLLAGIDLTDRTFLEAQYDIVERRFGTGVDGLSLMVGAKF